MPVVGGQVPAAGGAEDDHTAGRAGQGGRAGHQAVPAVAGRPGLYCSGLYLTVLKCTLLYYNTQQLAVGSAINGWSSWTAL